MSAMLTATSASVRSLNAAYMLLDVCVIITECGPSTSASSIALTVTTCAICQLAGVTVTSAGTTLTCAPVLTTSAVGAVAPKKVTAYFEVAPPSATVSAVVWKLMGDAETSVSSFGLCTACRYTQPHRLRPLTD